MPRGQADQAFRRLAGLDAVHRHLDAMVHRIAQQVHQRRVQLVQDVAVDLSGFALDLQSHLLAQRASQVAHHARHAAQAIAEGPHAAGQRRVVQALRQMPHAPAELVDLGRAFGQLALGLLDDALGVVQRRLHPRVDRLAGQRRARTPSSACPAPACMRRSRSMDALNGAIQCDSTSVSLDSPSSLFKVSAVTRSTRSPSASAWSLDRRSGAGSAALAVNRPAAAAAAGSLTAGARAAAQAMHRAAGWARCSGARPAGRSPRPARRRAWPRAAADPCPAAARRYRWPAGAAGLPAPPPGSLPSRARCAPPDAGRRCAPPLERMRRAHAGFQLRGRGRVVLQRQQAVVQHLHLGAGFQLEQFQQGRVSHLVGFTPDSVPKPASAGFHPGRPRWPPQRHPREYFRLAPATVAGKGSSRSRSTE